MGKQHIAPPEPAKQLYENLFVRPNHDGTLGLISEGLAAFAENASRLIRDVIILLEADRYASAAFLLATADEEMAKSYILLDACRLDFSRHRSALKCLCRAFYSHVAKYAYNQVARFSGFHDMAHVKELWDVAVTRWWPSGSYDSGEPDMPHETYFAREMPLYVDFIDYDQDWFTPQADTRKDIFEPILGDGPLSQSQVALDRLCETFNTGLYRPESLSILNETFKIHRIKEGTPTQQLNRLYEKVVQRIENELGIQREKFDNSALHEWPLYHFVEAGF